jgi:hypothetical protein
MALTDYLKSVADAIREKTGTTDKIPALDFPSRILSIPQEGTSGGESFVPFDSGVYYGKKDVSLSRTASVYASQYLAIPHKLGRTPLYVYFGYNKNLEGGDPSKVYIPKMSAYYFVHGIIPKHFEGTYIAKCQNGCRFTNINGGTANLTYDSNADMPFIDADEENIYIHGLTGTTMFVVAGKPYQWFAA